MVAKREAGEWREEDRKMQEENVETGCTIVASCYRSLAFQCSNVAQNTERSDFGVTKSKKKKKKSAPSTFI